MTLKNKIYSFLQSNFGLVRRTSTQLHLPGRTFTVLNSYDGLDYDDAWILALSMRANIVFDIGCNVGLTSLVTLYGGNVKEIFMIDAGVEALSVAAANLTQNHLINKARFINAFVSDKPDKK